MKIKLSEQELTKLGLVKEHDISLPSLNDEYSVDINTGEGENPSKEKYDSDDLSLASINRTKNLLVNDLHNVAFSGSYSDLSGVPSLATNFKNGLLSKEDFNKLSNLETTLKLKSDIVHSHKFSDLTDVPLATADHAGLMNEVHFRLLEKGLSKVATTGMYTDLSGKPENATEEQDGLLSKELFKEMNAIARTFGSSFTPNSNGIYVYNHKHTADEIIGIQDIVETCNIDIDNIIRTSEGYQSIYAGYDNNNNYYNGLMRGEDKDKLDKIDQFANHYIHPEKHDVTMIDGLSKVAITGAYSDLIGSPDILGAINNIDSQNGIALGSTGGLQIRKGGLPRISFQRGIQYFHDSNIATKAFIQLNEENEDQFEYMLSNNVNFNISSASRGTMVNIAPINTSFANCELEVTGNITLKHYQDPNAVGYNGLVLGTDTNRSNDSTYGKHSMGIIGDHTIGFGNKNNGVENYVGFINTRTGDMYLKGDIYIQGTINSAYKDETNQYPSLNLDSQNITRSIPSIADSLGVSIPQDDNGCINMSDTILALLDKIEELTDTIERHEIRLRQMEKELY